MDTNEKSVHMDKFYSNLQQVSISLTTIEKRLAGLKIECNKSTDVVEVGT